MGLGLSISKMIVEQLGGKIDVISEPGQGSNFSFTIKRNTEISEEEAKEEAKEESRIFQTEDAQFSDSENVDLDQNLVESIMQPYSILTKKASQFFNTENNFT